MVANDRVCQRPLTGRTVLICLIAFFAVISIVNGIMIRAAISTFGGVETGSAFQAGQAFKHDIEAATRAAVPTLAGESECAPGRRRDRGADRRARRDRPSTRRT